MRSWWDVGGKLVHFGGMCTGLHGCGTFGIIGLCALGKLGMVYWGRIDAVSWALCIRAAMFGQCKLYFHFNRMMQEVTMTYRGTAKTKLMFTDIF